MKKNIFVLFVITVLSITSCSFTTKKFDADSDKDKVLIELISFVINQGHYDMKSMNDDFSEAVYKDFMGTLDPMKRYFTQKQIKDLNAYKTEIDDAIKGRDITFFNQAYENLQSQMEATKGFYIEILDQPFNFGKDEMISTDYDELNYAKNNRELKERWRKQLKFTTLSNYIDLVEEQEQRQKDEDNFEPKPLDSLEVEARELTRKSLKNFYSTMSDLERKDWFGIYVNSIVSQFDPHTNYLAPQDKERFDISMSGKLEGIGARLQKQTNNIKIVEIISGGPAWKNGKLEVGDVIQKVKQEDEDQAVTITGMRLSDAVELIKGPKSTMVTLTVKKVDGKIENISIVRDVVEIEETYAKTAVTKKENHNYGIINLPKFYFDVNNYKNRNAASDIKKEIERLNQENVEGLVIDLRNNGGGSLSTVVDIAGFFIKNGPVVQVRDRKNDVEVLKDTDRNILWNKPLVILVNELSASASEILAAAMQDYKRAIIIGSKQTYGKGTVQNVVDLNRWMKNSTFGDMGALKITTQKFYRINGGSTQLKGVESDVPVPDRYSYIDIGERDYENPMPWDKIAAASYSPWNGYKNYDEVIKNSIKRLNQNKVLQLIDENAQWIKSQRDMNTFSLNYEIYRADQEDMRQQSERFEDINNYSNNLEFKALPYEMAKFESDSALAEKRNRWYKSLSKDAYVKEAIQVLSELETNADYKVAEKSIKP
ncbi:carboxy terminal-processing peptidase [Psychroflexus sp. ALD_RP9]|uniref:carboxy terminal-processing peptidase n=1 Tax=Psychroflexus sp. ALD_RP9 TaxID=2777186 RepID=UPI001A8DF96A|nr:carboxy terminal-processing peptidase [Psychroflexus sp. ALD_RP9]QSS96133.1 carboxy terminal-processing peptidase [Psychroflexus sp. ALD_RP9]